MRIIRILQAGLIAKDSEIELSQENHHYLIQVLRCSSGSELILFNGDGIEATAILTIKDRKNSHVTINDVYTRSCESPIQTTLIQGLSKGDKMDLTIQKAVELGINRVIPVITDYSVIKLDESRRNKKQEHWQAIANAATIQSGRTNLTRIDPITSLKTYLKTSPLCNNETGITLSPQSSQTFTQIEKTSAYRLLIGPEGGLSEDEITGAHSNGYIAVAMGPRVLRTETAALTALSILQKMWGDF